MKSGHLDGNPSAFFMPVFNCIVFLFPNQEFSVNYFISLHNSSKFDLKSILLSYPTNLPSTAIKSLKSLSANINSTDISIQNTAMKP